MHVNMTFLTGNNLRYKLLMLKHYAVNHYMFECAVYELTFEA
jgi:hypothetical protein